MPGLVRLAGPDVDLTALKIDILPTDSGSFRRPDAAIRQKLDQITATVRYRRSGIADQLDDLSELFARRQFQLLLRNLYFLNRIAGLWRSIRVLSPARKCAGACRRCC